MSTQKALQGSETEQRRELLVGMKEKIFALIRGYWFSSRQIDDFSIKGNVLKIELVVARPESFQPRCPQVTQSHQVAQKRGQDPTENPQGGKLHLQNCLQLQGNAHRINHDQFASQGKC